MFLANHLVIPSKGVAPETNAERQREGYRRARLRVTKPPMDMPTTWAWLFRAWDWMIDATWSAMEGMMYGGGREEEREWAGRSTRRRW